MEPERDRLARDGLEGAGRLRGEEALGRRRRARRLPTWRVAEAAGDGAEGDTPLKTPPASEADGSGDDDEAGAQQLGSFAGGAACWGIYYLPSGRDRIDPEQSEALEAPAAAPVASAGGGGGGTGEGGVVKKWVAPPLGAFITVLDGDGTWVKGEVVHLSKRHATLTVRVDGGAARSCMQKNEGGTWRRIGPTVNALVEVEVEEEGEVSWRLARVRRRFKNGDFTAVILFSDGSPDEGFVETFPLSAEGVDWRHAAQSNGAGFDATAMPAAAAGGGGGGGGGGGKSSAEAAATAAKTR